MGAPHHSKVSVVAPGDIDDEMVRADLAVCAGGTTSLELASLGVPMVIVIRADNQRPGAHVLEQIGCAVVAGEGRDGVTNAAQTSDPACWVMRRARGRMGAHGRKLVDGHGVEACCRSHGWRTSGRHVSMKEFWEDQAKKCGEGIAAVNFDSLER